jgi:hypothetical protein
LVVDNKDDVIALMETSKDGFGGYSGTTCRLYEVGRVRASRSDDEDEDEDEVMTLNSKSAVQNLLCFVDAGCFSGRDIRA